MLDPLLLRVGVVSTHQLTDLGWSKHARDAAIADGRIVRVRRGWYARVGAAQHVVAAVRSGGCVTCADALRLRGAWVPASLGRGHVRRAAHVRGRRGCSPFGSQPPVHAAVDDLATAFRCLLRCGSAEDVIVVADSLVHLGLATTTDLERWSEAAPIRTRALLARLDAAESGLETMVRVRLRSCGVTVRTQVVIGRHRVDLLVGDRLVIECDGGEHHGSWVAQGADRARDRELTVAGYRVVRLTYDQIVHDWATVERDLLAMIREDAHRGPRRRARG